MVAGLRARRHHRPRIQARRPRLRPHAVPQHVPAGGQPHVRAEARPDGARDQPQDRGLGPRQDDAPDVGERRAGPVAGGDGVGGPEARRAAHVHARGARLGAPRGRALQRHADQECGGEPGAAQGRGGHLGDHEEVGG